MAYPDYRLRRSFNPAVSSLPTIYKGEGAKNIEFFKIPVSFAPSSRIHSVGYKLSLTSQ